MTNRVFNRALPVLLVVLAVAGCSPKDDKSQAAADTPHNITLTEQQRGHIKLYTVTQKPFRRTIDATGAVDFDNNQATSVISPISGPVSRLLVEPGDRVSKGAPLAMVESSDFAAATSTYAKAVATVKNSRRIADADKDLAAHNSIPQRESDQAQTDAAGAEADRDAALQALNALNVAPQVIKDLQEGRAVSRIPAAIRSPIAGTVVEKLITPGQLLQAGTTPAFTVADLSRVWVMAQVYGADLEAVRVGDQAKIQTGAGEISGRVDNIAPLVNPDTRAVMVRVVVDNPSGQLKKGLYVRTVIESRQAGNALLVPVSAVLRDDENLPFVYVELSDGSFARKHVDLGGRSGDNYQVSGVKSGDKVVADGGLFVQFMQSQ